MLTWKTLSSGRLVADTGGLGRYIIEGNAKPETPYWLRLNGETVGFFTTEADAKARAENGATFAREVAAEQDRYFNDI